MTKEIIDKLSAIDGALNCVSVSGKTNLSNLSGSIALLEAVIEELKRADADAAAGTKADAKKK